MTSNVDDRIMIRYLKLLCTFLFAIASAHHGHAQGLIGSAHGSTGPGTTTPQPTNLNIVFDYGWQGGTTSFQKGGDPGTRIFRLSISTNDSGRTFFTDAATDAGFAGFVSRLTDGTDQYITMETEIFTFSEWSPQRESSYLLGPAANPDFAGYNITQIGLRLDDFHSYMEGNFYYKSLDYTLDFYGAPVPEPSTWALLALGAAAFCCATRRRRK